MLRDIVLAQTNLSLVMLFSSTIVQFNCLTAEIRAASVTATVIGHN